MIKRLYVLLMFFIAICYTLSSCDPREGDLPAWESHFLIPLLDANFDFKDITLSESLELREDSSGVLTMVYVSDKDSVKLKDFLVIPDITTEVEEPPIPNTIADFTFSADIAPADLGLTTGVNVFVPSFEVSKINRQANITAYFTEAIFDSGSISLIIKNGFPFAIDDGLVIEIINSDDGSVVLSHTTNAAIEANGSYAIEPLADLADKRMYGQLDVELRNISSSGAAGVDLMPENVFGLAFSLTDITLRKATMTIPAFELPPVESQFSFKLPFGAKLTSIMLRSGSLSGAITSNLNFPVNAEVTINSITAHGVPLYTTVSLFNEKNFELDLSNSVFDLTNNGEQKANTLSFSVKLSSPGSEEPVTINFEDTAAITISVKSLDPVAVFGYLGTYEALLEEGVELDIFNRVISGSINFEAPSVKAFISNELGMSAELIDNGDLYISGSNQSLFPGKEVRLTEALKDVKVKRAAKPGESEQSIILLNGDNEPAFSEFLSLLPNETAFSFPVQIGSVTEDLTQFAIDSSGISGHIEVEFPLAFQALALTITDTLDLDVKFENEYGEILSGELNTYVTNYFPIELLLQVYFMDDNLQVLDSMFLERRVIAAGDVNEEGKVIKPSKVNFVVGFSGDKLENLSNSTYAKPLFVLNTTEQEHVKVYSDSKVNFKVNGDFLVNLKNE